jgi:FlgD Ig-like domain
MKKQLFILMLIVYCFINLFSLTTLSVPSQYQTIGEAISAAELLSGSVTIEVSAGTYNEHPRIDLNATNLTSLSIIGIDGSSYCIINGTTAGSNCVEAIYEEYDPKFFKLSNFTISCSNADAIRVASPGISYGNLDAEITQNIINNSGINGNGIQSFDISKCVIKGNTITFDSPNPVSCIGINIIDIDNILIEGNHVSDYYSSNLRIHYSHGIILNNIIENSEDQYVTGAGIDLTTSILEIDNNLILVSSSESTSVGINGSFSTLKITNNTVIGFGNNATGIYSGQALAYEKFVNNIMWDLDVNIENYYSSLPEVNYCCFNGTIPTACQPAPGNNYNTNTYPDLTTDYHLSSNSTDCIDHADPDTNGINGNYTIDEDDRDPDGSRMDIGCYPYLHEYDTKHFGPGWQWVSFPVLENEGTYSGTYDPLSNELYEQAYYEDGEGGLLQTTPGSHKIVGFNQILGNRGNDIFIEPIGFNYEEYDIGFNNEIYRPKGYKIEVIGTSHTTMTVDGDRLPANHMLFGRTMDAGDYHWLGYWLLNDQDMDVAFGDFWQYVEIVKAEDWCYIDMNSNRGGVREPKPSMTIHPLEYGKAYLVKFNQDVYNFYWHDSGSTLEAEKKAKSENFNYEEKADYEVIDVVDIPANVSEIGVFEDETCVGAVVVEGSGEQILVYSDNANRDQIPFSFEVITGSRSISKPVLNYQVFNEDEGEFEHGCIISGMQDYSMVKFTEFEDPQNDLPVIEKVQLHNNYPNPFNPNTNISFSIPAEQDVKLTIYNLKGQKVRQLVNGQLATGKHSVVWEGKDDNGKQVGSGLYFYKLKTNDKEISKKMLLLK